MECGKRESLNVGNRVLGASLGLRGARRMNLTTLINFCDISRDSVRLYLYATLPTHKCVYCIVLSFSPLLVLCIL